jgi:ribonucleoside-diphosphate reductase alpha chain
MDNRNLYVTVNKNGEGEMVEVFATVGESKKPNTHHTSGVEDSWAEALGKVVSLALRAGVRPESIIRNLKNIPSDKPVFETVGDSGGSELLPSPSHAIARVMEEELQYIQNNIKIEKDKRTGGACTNCGSTEIRWKTSTCYDCLSCGYSGCG